MFTTINTQQIRTKKPWYRRENRAMPL